MPDLKPIQAAVLRVIAEAEWHRQVCPKIGAIAAKLGLRNAVMVAFTLRDLEGLGLLTGAPAAGATTTIYVELTDAGRQAAPTAHPEVIAPMVSSTVRARTGTVVEIAWRCADCGAVTLDTRTPCPLCAILAVPEALRPIPVVFQRKQGAA